MKFGRLLLTTLLLLFPLSLCIMCGCSTDAVDETDDEEVEIELSVLSVTASPNAIDQNESTTLEAIAYDASGNEIVGLQVLFTVDDPTLASVSASAITGSDGVAEGTLTSRGGVGEVNVTATSGDVSSTPATVYIQSVETPSQINLTVTPASIVSGSTASIQAEVLDSSGMAVADNTTVSFVSNDLTLGDFTASSAPTSNGFATATFKAEYATGTVSITVQCQGVSTNKEIIIYPADADAISFVSAEPQRIAIKGSGDDPTSIIQFLVSDSNGNPLNGELVNFELSSPGGGAYISPTEGSTDQEGLVRVVLHSGSTAGPATIKATISTDEGTEIVSQSSVVSIGGGVPSAKRFSVAATVRNLPGLEYNGRETEITAYLADRFGNYNMLAGTTVSFVIERGMAIDTSNVTVDEDGRATVMAYTQYPAGASTACEDVAEQAWETNLIDEIEEKYSASLPGHPRNGLCSVLVYVEGEEHFYDVNANGVYDTGEGFVDTDDDPFIDYNDDGLRDNGSFDPFEEYIDSGTQNGVWDGKNGVWDSTKNIFTRFPILITGEPYLVAATPTYFSISNGGSSSCSVIVCDRNGNRLCPGSKVSISLDGAGELKGVLGSHEFIDTNDPGDPFEVKFYIADSDAEDEDPAEYFTLIVTTDWEGISTQRVVAEGWID